MGINITGTKIDIKGSSNCKVASLESGENGQIRIDNSEILMDSNKNIEFAVQKNKNVAINSVYLVGFLSFMSIAGGIISMFFNNYSVTKINFLKFEITTGHVGIAFAGLGLISIIIVISSVIRKK